MKVTLYQIAYSDATAVPADPAFRIFDCRDDPAPERRETYHMWRFFKAGRHRDHGLSGLLSPKFTAKTKLGGAALAAFIEAHPGHDVYFVNPFPALAYLSFNVWERGEFLQPGLAELANTLLAAAGHAVDVRTLPRNTPATLLYCNYWVGNGHFWQEFMSFLGTLMGAVDGLPEALRRRLFREAPHESPGAPFYPFIFERMFSTFLLMRPDIKALAYPQPRRSMVCDTAMDALLIREWGAMIERWDAAGPYSPDQRRILEALPKISWVFRRLRTAALAGEVLRPDDA